MLRLSTFGGRMVIKPDEDVVRGVLAVRGRDKLIRKAIASAWEIFLARYDDRLWWRRKTTRAHVVWELSVDNIITALAGD